MPDLDRVFTHVKGYHRRDLSAELASADPEAAIRKRAEDYAARNGRKVVRVRPWDGNTLWVELLARHA